MIGSLFIEQTNQYLKYVKYATIGYLLIENNDQYLIHVNNVIRRHMLWTIKA
jgi:hypothetical protein